MRFTSLNGPRSEADGFYGRRTLQARESHSRTWPSTEIGESLGDVCEYRSLPRMARETGRMLFANMHTDGPKREGTPKHVNYVHMPQTAYGSRRNPVAGGEPPRHVSYIHSLGHPQKSAETQGPLLVNLFHILRSFTKTNGALGGIDEQECVNIIHTFLLPGRLPDIGAA